MQPSSPSPDSPVTVATTPTEWQAALITSALREAGLNAHVAGANLVGMRAEVPAMATVMVPLRELAQARVVLATLKSERAGLDWDAVDVSDDEAEPLGEDTADDAQPAAGASLARWLFIVIIVATLGLIAAHLFTQMGSGR